ncbi:ferredoxin reductase-like protein [Gymnopus androsaceus JB14]|uniref:cytochrome-b5 reductase n=1 Tax=Gymnopus androsaceus JB14 TaxID=1447944 RepID=A0A6A4IA55_9AGAR|nr:ferredoxin reductase-like protein [Gymnopus androsaceus JB14]
MTTNPVPCSVVAAAMKQSGMDYKAIASKTNLTEKTVEQLCTGRQQATPEQHEAISKALGIFKEDETNITEKKVEERRQQATSEQHEASSRALGRFRAAAQRVMHDQPSHSEKILYQHLHDVVDATGLLRHVRARQAEALKSGVPLKSHNGLNPPGTFTWLKLKNVIKYTNDCSRFDFAFEDPEIVSDVLVSSTCVVCAPKEKPLCEDEGAKPFGPYADDDDGPAPVYRAYTPITPRGSVGILSFAIKKQPNGKMSNYIHSLEIGDTLGITGYLQRVPSMIPWKINQYDAVTMIAGGVGLTPVLQVIEYSLHDPTNKTKFLLLFGNATESDIIMRSELDALQRKFPAYFNVVHVLSRPPQGWTGETGRINAAVFTFASLVGLLLRYVLERLHWFTINVLLPGPPAMLDQLAGPRDGDKHHGFTSQGTLSGTLKDIGYTAEQVHKF